MKKQIPSLLFTIFAIGIITIIGGCSSPNAVSSRAVSSAAGADQAGSNQSVLPATPDGADQNSKPPDPTQDRSLKRVHRTAQVVSMLTPKPRSEPVAPANSVYDPRAVKLADDVMTRPLAVAIELFDREFEKRGMGNVPAAQ